MPPSIAYRAMGRGPHLSVPLLCPETWGESRSTPPPARPVVPLRLGGAGILAELFWLLLRLLQRRHQY